MKFIEPIEASGDPLLKAQRRMNLAMAVETGIALANGWPVDKIKLGWLEQAGFTAPPQLEVNDLEKHLERIAALKARRVAEMRDAAHGIHPDYPAEPEPPAVQLPLLEAS